MLKQDSGLRNLQDSLGNVLALIPLTPNQWTFFSLILALVAGIAIALFGNLAIGLALFAFAGLFDVIDGAVARARGEVSALGGFIDGIADRFVEAIFLFSFMFLPLPAIFIDAKIWIALAVFLGTCMPSFIRAYADHKGALSKEKANALGGIFERSERIIVLVLGLGFGLALSMDYFVYSLMVVSALSLVTIIERMFAILNQPKVSA